MLAALFVLLSITGTGTATEVFVQEGDSIQEAVNSALPGDVIIVKPGTYSEQVIVTTSNLVIRSESGSPEDTVIKANNPTADVFTIQADNITFKGFMITGAGVNCSGLYLYGCNNCLIESNKFLNDFQGIYLKSSLRNKVLNNVVFKGGRGIRIEESNHNSVSKNKVSKCGYGIYLLNSKENTISKNTVLGNKDYGILFMASNSNTLSRNNAFYNSRGIHIGNSDGNTLSNNVISSNEVHGLFVCPRSDKNLVYNNYFNNTLNVEANNGTSNAYSKPKTSGENIVGGPFIGGNYWATPNGTGFSETAIDANGDGIADKGYMFETSDYFDPLPLMGYNLPEPILPKANLSINITKGHYIPVYVHFTDVSENATSRFWDFENDGIIDSSDENTIHAYTAPGTYIVNLTVSNANGMDVVTATIDIQENGVTEIRSGSEPGEENANTTGSQAGQSSGQEEISMPGFEMIYGILCLIAIFLYKETAK